MAVWDAALRAVRSELRGRGLAEVLTPLRLPAVAVEPFIEPIAAPPGLLATSPELPMKRLLCRGAPSIFQVTPCFRAAEHGDLHREEFHMVEWYRVAADAPAVRGDVERVVEAVFEAVAGVLPEPPVAPPRAWIEAQAVPLMAETLGVTLRGDEDAPALRAALRPVSARLGDPLATVRDDRLATSPRAHALAAWTALFSAWCDVELDPWLAARRDTGVHLVELPPALAALSEVAASERDATRTVAHRFESHVHGRELANGYRELRDADEQRRRFADVNALRASLDEPALPVDEAFLEDLRAPGLPPCAGVALGLDRLVLLACGRRRLADVALELPAAP
ncbi:MAG: hypothetical protein H6712_02815 [Myxococcales bacterium]|nr:hypothetical protein [Myxococcales bacterium]